VDNELLAFITREIESISRDMHDLARRKNILQEAATRLRTGQNAAIVEAMLDVKGVQL